MYPRLIHWEDGKTYEIDRILDVRPAPAARAGGQGDRYTIRMNNQEKMCIRDRSLSMRAGRAAKR